MIAICSTLIDQEETHTMPNMKRITELEKQQANFQQERRALHVDSKEEIIQIQKE